MKTHHTMQQRGIGLLEILFVLTIVATVILLSARYYLATQKTNNISNTVALVGDIHKAATTYAKRKDFQSLDINTLQGAGLLTQVQSVNPWNGSPISVQLSGTQVVMTFTQVPEDACQDISNRLNKSVRTTSGSTENVSCSGGTTLTARYDLY